MSLDIYLNRKLYLSYDKGKTYVEQEETMFSANTTHNLGKMASEAGIYEALWRPSEIKAVLAKDIIEVVEKGLSKLKKDPEHFIQFNAENGWGTYDQFVPFVERYLEALKEFPESEIEVST